MAVLKRQIGEHVVCLTFNDGKMIVFYGARKDNFVQDEKTLALKIYFGLRRRLTQNVYNL